MPQDGVAFAAVRRASLAMGKGLPKEGSLGKGESLVQDDCVVIRNVQSLLACIVEVVTHVCVVVAVAVSVCVDCLDKRLLQETA